MSILPYDKPFHTRPTRSFVISLLIAIGLVVAAFQSIGLYVESLWFGSLGFESVFWYRIKAQSFTFLAFFVSSMLVLSILFRLVTPSSGGARRQFLEFGDQRIFLPVIGNLKNLARPVAVLIGLFLGLAFSADWTAFALFFNRPAPTGVADPIFGRPLSFFLFTLPVLDSIATWLMAVSIAVLLAAVALSVTDMTARFHGVSVALSLVLAAIACQTFLGRYGLLLKDHSLFSGISYVDDKILVPGLWLTAAALLAGSGIAAMNVAAGQIRNLIIAIAIPAVTYAGAGVIVPAYVTNFVVRPNELVRETPYIHNNIQFTRKAFGLDHVEEVPFEPRLTNAVFDPNAHKAVLDNIRLWDWRALQDTLRQVQEIRTYYDFPDVDVDRYMVDGKPVEMMLAAREFSLNKLPSGSRNWVNERLIYTHGYGVTMNPVSQFTREGLPQFVLSNMPVESTRPEIQVKRPEIYFGELTESPVYVKTHQKEFNYSEGDANNFTTYEGSGGIRMGSLLRRLLLAFQVGDLTKVPFSDDVTADSALLLRRNIMDRASTLAPFLSFDTDPYLVVGEDGSLYWIIDAFTSSDQYPYSRHVTVGNQSVNYMRNSVKTVIDAYNGNVSFYVFDSSDPLIDAYQRMFPQLFRLASSMPEFLRKHIRYPEFLFRVQASLYTTYHVQNEQVFYNREDVWTVAQQGRSQGGQPSSDAIDPFFILMTFPGESKLEFVSTLPFTPANRNNLIGWIGGRSDGDTYGKLRAYHFPNTRFVDGPLQIEARIDQDPQLSSQLTLWNQQGSKVIRGNLLVIPLDDTLLFAQPMYLQAERSPMPELRLVVLATQDRLAYATTFDEALRLLLEGRGNGSITAPSEAPSAPTPTTTTSGTPDSIRTLIERANQAFADYRRLTADGKLAEAGAKLEELKRTIEELNRVEVPRK